MRVSRLLRTAGWRFAAGPLAVWLALTLTGVTGLVLLERGGRETLVQRFQLRVQLVADFINSYVANLIERERVQAEAFLTEPVVDERDFFRSVNAFGYPAAVLLDSEGRALHVAPRDPSMTGRQLAANYAHLRTALVEGRPAVSPVVPSVARGQPVVGFAVPFETTSGRRVFSGAVEIASSPLGAYLNSAISIGGVKVHLLDASGVVVAANHEHSGTMPKLETHEPRLAAALERGVRGRYSHDGENWRYESHPIPGTPWVLSASVAENVLYAPVAGSQIGGRAAVVTASAVGLLVVVAAARARRNRRELKISEELFRRVFDDSRVGMTLNDTKGRLIRVNPALCQMLGRSENELVGRSYLDITHPDDHDVGASEIQACLDGRAAGFTVEKQYVHADGHVVEASLTAAVLRDENERPQLFATQVVDVTERRAFERAREQHERDLAERAEQLQQANNQMADFIAMLTHDVRQPLTGIVSGGDVLLDDWMDIDDETRQRYVRRMTAAGRRADHIVTEILTLAQLDAGAIATRQVAVDVHDVVRQAVIASDAPVSVSAPDEAPAFADPVHLQLMLGNLISNAVKYGSPPYEIAVVRLRDRVQIRVVDHGEGVPEQFVPHLFDRFARADTGIATVKPGTGLGLHFVRQLADASGVEVGYQPREPHGAVFTLTLPATGPGQSGSGRRSVVVPRDFEEQRTTPA
ncbi:sensor histidine kinase [Actinoplanes aureus]|uniref:Sensor-like histidine kinase SenX3 n=1 Tax=Actinoplanes aureus TaxID=2792083 RepID=A0A931G3G7_9ACTN|nr:sensor histidine kinase [Actinoplanes aureus]MBG0568827.1 PAS domain S-box protein [Actinoplanes aureus]